MTGTIDFTNCKKILGRAYNGANGKKIAVEYNGREYMLKFPPSGAAKPTELSYTNSCISEHIASSIFNMVGIKAQETLLGTYEVSGKVKVVCACRDFTEKGYRLFDFCSIKNTILDSESGGSGTELADIMDTIEKQQYVEPSLLMQHFFNVFVVDALLGNFDRHNGNWGFLYDDSTKEASIAPVYDCGSCLLPQADERITGDFETLPEKIPPYENAWYVVVIRGHLGDSACARAILKRPFAYFGMIGSKTKVRITREKLLAEGFTEDQVNSIHAPIGLPIGGQMPAEIAVSIMAEIVQEKNRHFRTYCDEEVEAAIRLGAAGTMVTIIEKKGSSPRGTGSKMFVFRDGRTVGSIGGGKVEFEAGKYASQVQAVETRIYELGQGKGDLGMICGGTVRVLFEPVNAGKNMPGLA